MQSVMTHSFSQAPTADIPRSQFDRSHGLKTTFDAGKLVPIFCDEVIPGDTINLTPTLFGRMNTPIYPLMDNLIADTHFFFVPTRQVWENFRKFCGEQVNPGDSIDYTVPTMTAPGGGYSNQSIFDYLGLPTGVAGYEHSALPLRAVNHIYNEWFRDQNLIDSKTLTTGDSGDSSSHFDVWSRGKRHDYFTSCLPWLQKGDSVALPLGTSAPVNPINGATTIYQNATGDTAAMRSASSGNGLAYDELTGNITSSERLNYKSGLEADLSTATASTVNELRQAFQIQKLLERDARSGTRYSEVVKAHFGVNFMDVTYRPEYLGGSSSSVNMREIATTTDGTRKVGDLAAAGTFSVSGPNITKSFTEHGYVIGFVSVRADLTYQQGLDRMWSRSTRYDFYWPALAHIGEQAVLNKEIYTQGTTADDDVFGYQERWAEMRYKQSRIAGKMRSNDAQSLDAWHLSQEFSSLPGLNSTFITENPPMDRVVAVTTEPDFHMDSYFRYIHARPMPIFSVPGLIDHF